MQTHTLQSGRVIRCYADIDEFPSERRAWLTRYQIEDGEIDTTVEGLLPRLGAMIEMNQTGRKQDLDVAIQNFYVNILAMKDGYAPDLLSLGVLTHDIDGVAVTDLSPDGLRPIMEKTGITVGELNRILADLKKNWHQADSSIDLWVVPNQR